MSICVIGAGYWGKNLVRNFSEMGVLESVCDARPAIRDALKDKLKNVHLHASPEDALKSDTCKAVVIATPAETHFELARSALIAGKDVFVEKPLALKLEDAEGIIHLAREKKKILMVGHLLQYHPAVVALKEIVRAGELGKVEYIYSNRLNLGKIRQEENALWSFAPHDISVMLWLMEAMPIQVTAVGGNYLQPNISDTTISTFVFENGVRSHIYVSWLHPFKEQRLVVVGSKKMAVFDDRAPKEKKLLLYEKKISKVDGQFVAEKPEGMPVSYDMEQEPLRAECEHFLQRVQDRDEPRTNGQEGLRVLKILQACQRSLEMSGQPVQL